MEIPIPNKILIPRFDAYGDLIILSGFLKELQNIFPKSEIHILVRKNFSSIKTLFPKYLIWKEFDLDYFTPKIDSKKNLKTLEDYISSKNFNLILFTCYNLTWIDWWILNQFPDIKNLSLNNEYPRTPYLNSKSKFLNLKIKKLFNVIKIDEKEKEYKKYQTLLNKLGSKNGSSISPEIALSKDIIEKAKKYLYNFGFKDLGYVVCNPAGSANIKIKLWDKNEFAKLLFYINKNYKKQIILVGHISEKNIIDGLSLELQSLKVHHEIFLGEYDGFEIIAGLMHYSYLFIGNDSSNLHLASALKIPTVSFFSGAHWPRFIPSGKKNLIFTRSMSCFNCDWNCIYGDAPCVKLIQFDDILTTVDLFLKKKFKIFNNIVELKSDMEPYFYNKITNKNAIYFLNWKSLILKKFSYILNFLSRTKKYFIK